MNKNPSSVFELKYNNHIFRNVYLYFLIFLTSLLLYGFQPEGARFFIGITILVFGYSSVYFFNDYADHVDDPKYGKRNLYLDISNKKLFWGVTTTLLTFGFVASALLSKKAIILFSLIIAGNLIYSLRPFRFRDIPFVCECTLFAIYFVKWFYIFELLGVEFNNDFPLSILILGSTFAALMGAFYKRHLRKSTFAEYFFGAVFFCVYLTALYQYPTLWTILVPVVPVGIYLGIRYKNTQIPFGRYQILHFIYLILVYCVLILSEKF